MEKRTKWMLGLGLGCLPVVSCGGCVLGVMWVVFGALSSSQPCRMAVSELNQDPVATEMLGSPIEPGWLVTGELNLQNGDGHARLHIPVSGPKGSGQADVQASAINGVWTIQALSLTAKGEKHVMIDDLAGQSSTPDLPAEAIETDASPVDDPEAGVSPASNQAEAVETEL